MTTKKDTLQAVWRQFEYANDYSPKSAREAVEWAVEAGKLDLPEIDPLDVLAGQMSRALREEYIEDEYGRRHRVNHAVRVTKDGVQKTFWGIMGFADHGHMQKAFTQRREQIVGDCLQLQVDVEVYNEKTPLEEDIQLVLEFGEDVDERRAA